MDNSIKPTEQIVSPCEHSACDTERFFTGTDRCPAPTAAAATTTCPKCGHRCGVANDKPCAIDDCQCDSDWHDCYELHLAPSPTPHDALADDVRLAIQHAVHRALADDCDGRCHDIAVEAAAALRSLTEKHALTDERIEAEAALCFPEERAAVIAFAKWARDFRAPMPSPAKVEALRKHGRSSRETREWNRCLDAVLALISKCEHNDG